MMELVKILERLVKYPECEFIEYKENIQSAEEIGERISAIANSASLHNKPYGYLVFGVKDSTRDIVGTDFCAKSAKKGNEILELWLVNRLNPKIDFETIEFDYKDGVHISMYKIPAASGCPVNFINRAYIRVNSATRPLNEFRDKEEKIWRKDNGSMLFQRVVKDGLTPNDIVSLLSTETYFDIVGTALPTTQQSIVDRFCSEHLAVETENMV